jgi:hypothetical protein
MGISTSTNHHHEDVLKPPTTSQPALSLQPRLLILQQCVHPSRITHTTKLMLTRTTGNPMDLMALRFQLRDDTSRGLPSLNVRYVPHLCAHQTCSILLNGGLRGMIMLCPVKYKNLTLQPHVRSDGGNLPGVGALETAFGHDGVCSFGHRDREDMLQLPRFIAIRIRDIGVEILSCNEDLASL